MTDSGDLGVGGKLFIISTATDHVKVDLRVEILRCMHLARTRTSPTLDCESGRWEQTNALSDWLDAGNVYGSNEEELEHVRDQRDRALLAVSSGNLLPTCSARPR